MYRRTPIFFRIMDSFFRHQLLFWSALLIVSSLTMAALYARSKTFHATAMTQVQTESVASVLGAADTNTWITPSQKHVDRFTDLIKQNQPGGFLDTAMRSARLVTPINVDPQADDPRYTMLQKNLTATADSPNQFSINLTWDNPDETKSILDALQKQYIEEVGLDRSVVSTGSVNFLNSQIAKTGNRLRLAESALSTFKASYGGQLSDAESFYSNQIASDKAELGQTQRDADQKAKTAQVLKEQLVQMKPMNIFEQTVSDQSPLEKEVAGLLVQRDSLLIGPPERTPQHPLVVAIDRKITQLQGLQRSNAKAPENQHNTQTKMQDNPGYQSLKLQIADAEIARDSDQQAMQDLKQRITKNNALVNQIPNAQRLLADKMRDYQEAQTQDHDLRQKRDLVQMQANLDRQTASDSLMPVGVTFATPTTGKTKLIAMLLGSLLLGCVVGVILVVLSEWSDHSLRHEADAERLLGVPVLAALPESADLRTTTSHRALSGAGAPALSGPASEG
jgi:uncharacterized protein involved in exopolysaccharide biosynthesis